MERIRWQERIVIAPDLHHGEPCVKGTRIPVTTLVGSLADGMTPEQIQEAYPQLTQEDIQAALAYAAEAIHRDVLAPRDGGHASGHTYPSRMRIAPARNDLLTSAS